MAALNRSLLVTDGSTSSASNASKGEWDVLLIGIDARTFERKRRASLARLGAYRLLDTVAWVDQVTRDVREFVIPLLHGLPERPGPGGKSLANVLRASHGNYWWFLEVSEKSPMRGTLVQDLFELALIRRALSEVQYHTIVLEIANARLLSALRSGSAVSAITEPRWGITAGAVRAVEWMYWIQAARQLLQFCMVRAIGRLSWHSASELPSSSVLFFTMYPQWWLRAGCHGASDRFFPDLPDSHQGIPLRYAAWVSSRPRRLWAERRKWTSIMGRRMVVPLQQFVPLRAAMGLLSPVLFFRLVAFRRACERTNLPPFLNCDVTPLVAAEVSRSIGSSEFPLDRLLFAGLRSLAAVARPLAVVYRAECQPIERALLYAGRGYTRMIGFWHSALSLCENYLPFRFPPGSLRPGVRAGDVAPMPLPDAMLVTGDICKRTVTDQGYPASRVSVCGPIRHCEALALARRRPDRRTLRAALGLPESGTVVFVAASVVPADTRAMLGALGEAVGHMESCVVIVKMHPAAKRLAAELRELRLAAGEREIRECTSQDAMYELMAASDAVITGGSTLAFEAIVLGVAPILFEAPSSFSASSFVPFEHACFIARSAAQLTEALHSVLRQDSASTQKRKHWARLVREVFGDVTIEPHATFLQAISVAVRAPAM